MPTAIVQLNVSATNPPAPSLQQQLGAILSQGATTLAANAKALLTTTADLTAILKGTLAITTVTWSASVVTATVPVPHGIPNGDIVQLTISGVTPAGYNGTFLCTATGASTFTYPLVANPGAQTVAGVYTPEDVAELVAQVTTFFAQGAQQAIYVLELGLDQPAAGVTALTAYIAANQINGYGPFYWYWVPRTWAAEATFIAFVGTFGTLTSKTYFAITTTSGQFAAYANKKAAFTMIEAPGIPVTEFTIGAPLYKALNYKPTATNKVTPFCYSDLFGVTQYPQPNNTTNINTWLAAFTNLVLNGAEGGLTDTILRNGTMMDGKDFTYWYAVDWLQINVDRDVSAAVINGSNNPQNPLYYNQAGIDRLQAVIVNTITRGVQAGMILGAPVQVSMSPSEFAAAIAAGTFAVQTPINAWNFRDYSIANPNDFAQGLYTGFSIAFTPNRGFSQIIISVNVSNFVAS